MKTFTWITAVLVAASLLGSGTALAQTTTTPPSAAPGTPARISGQVTDIDQSQKMVTIRGDDGKTYKFQASDETLKDLKKGDKLDATLRAGSSK